MTENPPPTKTETPIFLRILIGPTASGKEEVAMECARRLRGEILSVDSMKVYRGLDIGTAKPKKKERDEIPHHGLDWIEPTVLFSVADWVKRATRVIEEIASKGRPLLLSGGTALYYKGLLEGMFEGPPAQPALRKTLAREAEEKGVAFLHDRLKVRDPVAAQKIHPHDLRRVIRALEVIESTGEPLSVRQTQWRNFYSSAGECRTTQQRAVKFRYSMVGLRWERAELVRRIDARIERMISEGLVEEAREVFAMRERLAPGPLQAVGYKEFFPFFQGEAGLDLCIETLKKNTRRLAKSQMTWFKKFPCRWIELDSSQKRDTIAEHVLSAWEKDRAVLET